MAASPNWSLDGFDLSPVGSGPPPPPPPNSPPHGAQPQKRKGILGALAAAAAAIAKFGAGILAVLAKLKFLLIGLKFGKLLVTFGSMFVSMWFYAKFFGWPVGVGFVLLIFLHECGHALAAISRGRKIGMLVLIPFCGGVVTTQGCRDAPEEAFVGIMGPVAGTLVALACWGLGTALHSPVFLVLAMIGFWLNLINLAPAPVLDGGHILAVVSPRLLLPGVIVLVALFWHNPMIWILGGLGVMRAVQAWNLASEMPYYTVTTGRQRAGYLLSWLALAGFLSFCHGLTRRQLKEIIPEGLSRPHNRPATLARAKVPQHPGLGRPT